MTALFTVLRWLCFMLCLCGWFSLTVRLTKLKPAFVPVVTLCTLTVALFTFGLLHWLQPMAWILFFMGIGLLIFYVILALCRRFSFSFLISPGMVFFFVASAVFIPILWGVHYYHYDNFSHWGTVLSEMLHFNDFPTAKTVVVFRDYAPGTASFLYWFCSVAGRSEDIALMGQALFSCAALSPLFFRVRKVRSLRFFAFAVLSVVLVSLLVYDDGTLQVYNLLVDALMGFLAVSAWFLREEYRDRPLLAWAFITPVLTFLILVKSNAVLLLVFFALFLFYDSRKASLPRRKRWLFLMPFAGVCLWDFLWKTYREVTYGTDTDSYAFHGIVRTFQERTPSFYAGILRTFWDKITDFSKIYVLFFAVLNLMVIGALFLLRYRKKNCKYLFRTWLSANGLMMGYSVALLFMYGFIMAVGEAQVLAAFERYMMTPTIFFTAILAEAMIFSFYDILERRTFFVRFLPLCISLLLFSLVSGQAVQLVSRPDFASTERGLVMETLQEAAEIIPRNSKVAMCNGERGRRDLYYYLMLYELKTRVCFDLDFRTPEYGIATDVQMVQHYDYLVISAKHYRIVSELCRAGYEVQWRNGCSVYRIKRTDNGKVYIYPAVTEFSN